jgi:DNA-directed RNA polymerase subunit RPC12/RpoP
MLHVIKFKGCRRCGGDVFLERDVEGIYIACLQCGAIYDKRATRTDKAPRKVPAR